jgi:hypothetical protein
LPPYLTYYVVRPEGRRNYGELITPQRMLPAVSAISSDGSAYPLTSLKDQWLLISVSGGACEAVCQKNLYFNVSCASPWVGKKTGWTGSFC